MSTLRAGASVGIATTSVVPWQLVIKRLYVTPAPVALMITFEKPIPAFEPALLHVNVSGDLPLSV